MSAPHSIHHRTEPLADGVSFILPRRPNGTGGGLCLIFFGLIFSGFAVFWTLGATGLLDGVLDNLFGDAMSMPDDWPGEDGKDGDDGDESTPKAKDKAPGPEPIEPVKPAEPLEPVGPEPTTQKKDKAAKPEVSPSLKEWYEQKVEKENKKRGSGYGGSGSGGGFDIGRIFFGLFGLPFFLAGLVPIAAGIMSIFGHTEVTVTADELINTDRAGFIRRRKSCALASIERFDVGRDVNAVSKSGSSSQTANQRYTFAIHAQRSERLLSIASGYPMLMLLPLAQDLARELQRRVGGQLIEVRDTSHLDPVGEAQEYIPEIVPPQPEGSTVVLERVASGITLKVPPMGFSKSTSGLFVFSAIWLGFISLFTLGMFAAGVPLGMYLFLSIFWFVGILMLLLALNMARKQAVFDVVHDTLLLTQQGIFGTKMHEWRVDDLIDIRADFSGTSVNKRPLLNIQITAKDGKNASLLTGREDAELQWIAAELRRAMGMRKRE